MTGTMTFQDALKMRLDIINPSQKQIREFIQTHPSTISPGIRDLMAQLKAESKKIYLISGGFDCLIEPVAQELGIPLENLFANKLVFYFDGKYAGFDSTQPTSRTGGKGEAIKQIKKRYSNDTVITMIGDGATDLEAAPPADYFIGKLN
jgi:phosphoserine phosphatase